MEKPDANGFVNVTWPSKNIPHGGIFHSKTVEPNDNQQQFLKVLLEESKLSIAQRQKSAWGLRQPTTERSKDNVAKAHQPLVRPRTSRRRSLSAIRESGALEIDPYRPLKRGEDREKLKDRLANTMAYGDTPNQAPPPAPRLVKSPPKLPTTKEKKNELLTQIRERVDWLAEMEELGQAEPHRDIIKDQIVERLRALDVLGVDSEYSSPRSSVSGFSTLRSRENIPLEKRSVKSNRSSANTEPQEKLKSAQSSAKSQNKEENVAAYSQIPPLQYSPRRRV